MKKLLNTLYVTKEGAYQQLKGKTVCVRIEKETKLRLPLHTLEGIVCMGPVSCSSSLMGACAEHKVSMSFLSWSGRFLARVNGPVTGNVLLRREQYRRADRPVDCARIAQSSTLAKLANSRKVLQRAIRDQKQKYATDELQAAVRKLEQRLLTLQEPFPLDALRGIEGEAAKIYFQVFDDLIVQQKGDFSFQGRNRRPPLDPVNALLSFIYTLLCHDVVTALETVGLDPYVGFLHKDRPGRPSLALDMMEELRPVIADRMTLSIINLKQVTAKGFRKTESGAVKMNDATRKTVLQTYQKRKMEEIVHPFIQEQIPYGLLPFVQAQLLSRHLRSELSEYPPFIWR